MRMKNLLSCSISLSQLALSSFFLLGLPVVFSQIEGNTRGTAGVMREVRRQMGITNDGLIYIWIPDGRMTSTVTVDLRQDSDFFHKRVACDLDERTVDHGFDSRLTDQALLL